MNKPAVMGEYENLIHPMGTRLTKKDKTPKANSWKERRQSVSHLIRQKASNVRRGDGGFRAGVSL